MGDNWIFSHDADTTIPSYWSETSKQKMDMRIFIAELLLV